MFGAVTIGLLAGVSIAVWTYTKVMRQTGNNARSSAVTAAIVGGISVVVIITIVWTIDASLAK